MKFTFAALVLIALAISCPLYAEAVSPVIPSPNYRPVYSAFVVPQKCATCPNGNCTKRAIPKRVWLRK